MHNLALISFLSLCLLLLAGCGEKPTPDSNQGAQDEQKNARQKDHEQALTDQSAALTQTTPPEVTSKDNACAELLLSPDRPAEDRARDEGRKPAEVLAFLGLRPNMTTIDLIAAGGYYTEVLSRCTGPDGKVYAQNPEMVLKFRDGANDKAMTVRLEGGRLANVVRWDSEFGDLGIEPNSVDLAITALNFHDIYNRGGSEAAQAVLHSVYQILKPGGVLGIIDHVGKAGADNKALHRIEPEIVRQEALKAGFLIDGESDLLADSEDAHDKFVFDEDVRGKTDRFLFRLKKPIS